MIANFGDPLVRRAHESPNAFLISYVQDLNDGAGVLKSHGLGMRLVLGQVVDPEELIVAEQYAFHNVFSLFSG